MTLIATIGGVLALVFWGLGDYSTGKSGQKEDRPLTALIVQLVPVVLLLPFILLYGISINFDASLLIVFGGAAFLIIAYISFVKSMSIGPFGVAAPIANSYALITLLIGFTIFRLQLSLMQGLALFVIIAGVIILSFDRASLNYRNLRGSTVFYAIITMICWGVGFAFLDVVVDKFTWYQLVFLLSLFTTILSFLYYIWVRRALPSLQNLKYKNAKYAWHAGLLLTMGTVGFFAASEYAGSCCIPAVIASAAPLVTSFVAYARDGEKLSLYKRIGAVVVIIGLMLLNM